MATIDDFEKQIADLGYQALVHAQNTCAAMAQASTEVSKAAARMHAKLAADAAGQASVALARARDLAHGERAKARKEGRANVVHDETVAHVEMALRSSADLAHAFASTARSVSTIGLAAHDRRITLETIQLLTQEASLLSNKLGEHGRRADLLADANTLRAQLAEKG